MAKIHIHKDGLLDRFYVCGQYSKGYWVRKDRRSGDLFCFNCLKIG